MNHRRKPERSDPDSSGARGTLGAAVPQGEGR